MRREDLDSMGTSELIDLLLQAFTIIEELTAENARLKEQVGQNSGNSSKPPSSDGDKKTVSLRQPSGKKPGEQKGHKRHGKKPTREPDEIRELVPAVCGHCGADLTEAEAQYVGKRYEHELPTMDVRLVEYRAYKKRCPHCGEETTASFPEHVSGTQQYDPNIRALVVMLAEYGMVSVERTGNILNDILEVPISTGTIATMIQQCADNAEGTVADIRERVKQEPVVHFDETRMRREGSLCWLHAASSDKYTYLTIHKKRGGEAMDVAGILPEYQGVAMHDCFSQYFRYVQASAF